MESTGYSRTIDELGRIVLPAETRAKFDLKEKDAVEIFTDEGGIYLTPAGGVRCIFCRSQDDILRYEGKHLCRTCLEKMQSQAVSV